MWDPVEHGVSKSFLETWLTCREQARLRYIERLYPRKTTPALQLGMAVHHALAGGRPEEDFELVAGVRIREYEKQLLRKPEGCLFKSDPDRWETTFGMAELLTAAYWEYYQEDPESILSEATFKVPITTRKGRIVPITGRIDDVFLRNGKPVLRETKTKSRLIAITSALKWDLQIVMYCLGSKNFFPEKPESVQYNVIVTPKIRKKNSETIVQYLKRASDIVRSDFTSTFIRWNIQFIKEDWDRYEDWIACVLDDVYEWYLDVKKGERTPRHYENPTQLITKYGPSDYFDAIVSGDFTSLTVKERS